MGGDALSQLHGVHRSRPIILIALLLLIALLYSACAVPPEDNGGSAGGQEPTREPAQTEPAGSEPDLREPIVPAEKPSLPIQNPAEIELGGPAVGFVFADGLAPYKAAPVAGPQYFSEEGLTIVAVIDVGEGGQFFEGGHYHVGIDLELEDEFGGLVETPENN